MGVRRSDQIGAVAFSRTDWWCGMRIEREIMAVLEAAAVEGNKLVLTGQLDRKTYEATNKKC